jgi:hypothetical protein
MVSLVSVTLHVTNLVRNLDHVPLNPNEIAFQKSIKIQTYVILMVLYRIFSYFTMSILTSIPKHQFILVSFSTIM